MQPDEYHKLAALEDHMWYFRALHRLIGRELGRSLGRAEAVPAVLDAGCGTGGLMRSLRQSVPHARVTGLDLSPLACALARDRSGSAIVEGSVTAMPFAEASFDAVISADVLYALDDAFPALEEFHRVLRPGGWVVLNVPAFQWLWSYHDVQVQTKHRFERREVRDLLRRARLKPEYVTYRNFLVFPLVFVRRKLLPPPSRGESDVRSSPPWLEAGLDGLMAMEQRWLDRRWPLPLGSSVFAVARKGD